MKKKLNNHWFTLEKVIHQIPGRIRWKIHFADLAAVDINSFVHSLKAIEGVLDVRLNLRAGSLAVKFEIENLTSDKLFEKIHAFPYLKKLQRNKSFNDDTKGLGNVMLSLALIFLGGFIPYRLRFITTLVSALPVFREGLSDLLKRGISSHVLEAAAILISVFRGDYLTAHTTVFMIELGTYIEDSIVRKSNYLLKHMLNPIEDTVWIIEDGNEKEVPTNTLDVGTHVVVAAGNIIPVDGTVVSGEGTINESTMTGESIPTFKERGESVLSGTCVEEGRLVIYSEYVGANTAAARIAEYVEHSLEIKSNTSLEASKLADKLVPYVIGLSGFGYMFTRDFNRVAAVLQADYSCSLKLATPVAFKSAMYQSGTSGILVKGSTALEKLADADTFIFDKTGTLTEGELEVTDSIVFDTKYSPDDLIAMAASVEEHYFHPLALAIVDMARKQGDFHFDHSEVSYIVAHGVVSEIEGKKIIVGSRHFLEEHENIEIRKHNKIINKLYKEGKMLLYIGFDDHLIGIIALKDRLRTTAAETLNQLRDAGVKNILLLTGDHKIKAKQVAEELGIDKFYAELEPEDKAKIIEQLDNNGSKIAFVGDGINDAPALSGASVGIAMHKGANIAQYTSDITLLEDDITKIADVKFMANNTMKLINKNYKLSLWLNSIILGSALIGVLNPVATSFLHNGTTIGILLNAFLGNKKEKML